MTEKYENLRMAVEPFIAKAVLPTPETIRSWITQFRLVPDCQVDDADAERLARELEAQHGVSMKIGSVLVDFEGPSLEALKPDAAVASNFSINDNAEVLDNQLQYNKATKGWRMTVRFKVKDPKQAVEHVV